MSPERASPALTCRTSSADALLAARQGKREIDHLQLEEGSCA